MNLNTRLTEMVKPIIGFDPAVPSTSTPDYVSLKQYERLTVIILAKNATTVTGSAITLKQATSVGAGSEKALAFTKVYANTDTGAGDTLTETTVASNTFTTGTTNSKNYMYVIEVKAEDLDVNNGFDCVRAGIGDATAATITVLYLLWGAKYSFMPSAIID